MLNALVLNRCTAHCSTMAYPSEALGKTVVDHRVSARGQIVLTRSKKSLPHRRYHPFCCWSESTLYAAATQPRGLSLLQAV